MSLTAGELRNKIRLINEIDNTKKQIKNNYLSDVIANSGFADYTTRLFQPVITSQAKQVDSLDKLQEERIKKLEDNQQLMIEGISDKFGAMEWKGNDSFVDESTVGRREKVAPNTFLGQMMANRDDRDIRYGLRFDGSNYRLGDRYVSFSDDDTKMHIGDKEFDITPGVIHLLTMKTKPANDGLVTNDDVSTYLDLTIECGLDIHANSDKYKLLKDVYGWVRYKDEWMTRGHYNYLMNKKLESKNAKKAKANELATSVEILRMEQERLKAEQEARKREIDSMVRAVGKSVEEKRRDEQAERYREMAEALRKKKERESKGSGISLLPSNPKSLLEMLGYRLGSYQAGNRGLRNEIVDIADELYRQKAINTLQYKHINKIIANGGKKKIR